MKYVDLNYYAALLERQNWLRQCEMHDMMTRHLLAKMEPPPRLSPIKVRTDLVEHAAPWWQGIGIKSMWVCK